MFNIFKKKKIIIVHNGGFHADDVFACAALSILLKDNIKIFRSRDQRIIEKGDIIVDVGGIYDESLNKFDHHQSGGAGARENGIEYASIGLVWKKFGAKIAGSIEAARKIDQILIQAVDAGDNGINIANYIFPDVFYFTASNMIGSFNPTSLESDDDIDNIFVKAVSFAKEILLRQIKIANDRLKIERIIKAAYEEASDKRLIIIDTTARRIELMETLQKMKEPLFVVYPNGDGRWRATGILVEMEAYAIRKNFPVKWAGLRGEELVKASGVIDAEFCHRSLFTTSAKSKEGAIKLAQIALQG